MKLRKAPRSGFQAYWMKLAKVEDHCSRSTVDTLSDTFMRISARALL